MKSKKIETIRFPSIVGVATTGHMLVYDSKNRLRKLKKFNHETGRQSYYELEPYTGEVITKFQGSIPVAKVDTFEQWKEKQNDKNQNK